MWEGCKHPRSVMGWGVGWVVGSAGVYRSILGAVAERVSTLYLGALTR